MDMSDTFGVKDEKPKAKPVEAPPRKRVLIVDEPHDRAIQVLHSTVIFRPGQVLTSDHQIRLAEEHGILTRERK
jgi:hypothetical protein